MVRRKFERHQGGASDMRYVVTALLALGVVTTTLVPVAFAQSANDSGGRTVCPVFGACYQDPSNPWMDTTGPYNETPSNNNIPWYGGDTD
jgi:hypothetical protein